MAKTKNAAQHLVAITYRYDRNLPAYQRLEERARRRGVSLQQVIHDLIIAVDVLGTGGDLSDLMWVPDGVRVAAERRHAAPVPPAASEEDDTIELPPGARAAGETFF